MSEDRREWNVKYHTVPLAKVYPTRGLHRLEKGKRCEIMFWEDLFGGKRIMEGGQDGGRKLPLKCIPSPTTLNELQQPY